MDFRTVFRKETMNESRRLRSYLLRVAYVVLVFALIVLFYGGQVQTLGVASSAEEQSNKLTRLAVGLYTFTAWAQVLLAVLITPILVTASFQSEKRYGTLDLLSMSQLRDRDVVLGKVFAKYLTVLVLVMAGLPVLTMIKIFGYVDLQLVLGNFFCAVSAMLLAGAVAAYYGLSSKNLLVAIRNTYALLVGYAFGTLILGFVLMIAFNDNTWFDKQGSAYVTYVLNPAYSQYFLIHMQYLSSADQPSQWVFVAMVVCQVLVALGVAWYFLNRAETLYRWWRLGLSPQGQAFAAKQHAPARTSDGGAGGDGPAAKRAGFGRDRLAKISTAVLMVMVAIEGIAMIAALFAGPSALGVHSTFLSIEFMAIAVLVCVVAGASIAQETEDRTMIVLLTTPLTSDEILWRKLHGLLPLVGWPVLIMLAHIVIFAAIGQIHLLGAAILLLIIPAMIALMIVASVIISAIMATPSRAIAYALTFLVVITLGTFMAGMLIATAGSGAPTDPLTITGEFIQFLNPLKLIGENLKPGFAFDRYGMERGTALPLDRLLPSVMAVLLIFAISAQVLRMRFLTWVRRHISG